MGDWWRVRQGDGSQSHPKLLPGNDAFNNDLVIRYLDRVVVKDEGYEVAFKAGVTVEVEV